MKKIPLLIFLSVSTIILSAQANTWAWARAGELHDSNTYASPNQIATDPAGNVIVTGVYTSDSVSFGGFTLYNPQGTVRMYVAKYDSSGNVLWAKGSRGDATEYAIGIAVDNLENIYVCGFFTSSFMSFENDTLTQSPAPVCIGCPAWDDGFIIKLNATGNLQWMKGFGGDNWDALEGIVTDTSGNVYITGFFRSDSVAFGGLSLYDATGSQEGNTVLLKCDGNGQVVWARSSAWGAGENISMDAFGNLIFAGEFHGNDTITFGQIKVGSLDNIITDNADHFIAKYDGNGYPLWAQNTGIRGSNGATSALSCDPQGNAFLAGWFTVDSIVVGGQTLYGDDTSGTHYCVTKYGSDAGEVLWVRAAEGTAAPSGLATDLAGNTWVGGTFFTSSVKFGNNILYNTDSATPTGHIFMLEYDATGNVINAMALGGDSYDVANCLAMDANGNIYIAGYFNSDVIDFGTNALNSGGPETAPLFVAKYVSGLTSSIYETNKPQEDVNVFPNPSSNVWNISIGNNLVGSSAEIFDGTGRLIYEAEIEGLNNQLYLAVPAGVYLLTITSGDKRILKKLVKF